MPDVTLHFENIKPRLLQAKSLAETRDFLAEFLSLPDSRLLSIFGISNYAPQEVHGLKDRIFTGLSELLISNGWNCNSAAFGSARRDTFLMEMARRGLIQAVSRLLDMGADADYNNHGYGASTVLMSARDPEIMKKLLYFGANPLSVNAYGQTDFTYKMLRGMTLGARFYLYNTEKIPFQSLLNNFRECVLDRTGVPYDPMYPLCLVPVVPYGGVYHNIIDQSLIDAMLADQYLPFSSKALTFILDENRTVWKHICFRMKSAKYASPALLIAYLACMAKMEECRTPMDFLCLEMYLNKELPRDIRTRGTFSKAVFVYMLFSLAMLPASKLLRWLMLLGKIIKRVALWMDILGEEPFKVTNSFMPSSKKESHILQELTFMQSMLAMRINVTDSFGEFRIPDELTTLLVTGGQHDGL